jgi:hypothetical protein
MQSCPAKAKAAGHQRRNDRIEPPARIVRRELDLQAAPSAIDVDAGLAERRLLDPIAKHHNAHAEVAERKRCAVTKETSSSLLRCVPDREHSNCARLFSLGRAAASAAFS